MCFERHATSKIRKADDLFSIRTMGFRGEAMASIAAIAQIELKTKRENDSTATKIEIEGSELITHEPCSSANGTSISVKNIFYNVPARRKFLKSDAAEFRNILEEFHRVALSYPHIAFELYHNGNEIIKLMPGTFRQRIVGLFGNNYNERLVPIEESTNIAEISGFIGKPEFAKKSPGEQYFFVNSRFIKSPYLHHAVSAAYDQLISPELRPVYFINLIIDPQKIDINIHPTKTEIKFDDEKSLYAILRSASRQALGKHNLTPSLDFDQETGFNVPLLKKGQTIIPPSIKVNPDYNPFNQPKKPALSHPVSGKQNSGIAEWEKFFPEKQSEITLPKAEENKSETGLTADSLYLQIHNKYILAKIRSGYMIIHQQRAHERILYEQRLAALNENKSLSQQELFPQKIELSSKEFSTFKEIEEEIKILGFDIRELGNNTIVVYGIPAESESNDLKKLIEHIIADYEQNESELKVPKTEKIARSLARSMAIKTGKKLSVVEMNDLTDKLFACNTPYYSPSGKPVIITVPIDELDKRFE
jgi:DNA mismatch repair protein MutL